MYTKFNTKLFSICYLPEHFSSVGTRFEPWDNIENLNADLREFPIFERAFNSDLTKNLDFWGLVSPKFEKKAGITGSHFLSWIDATQLINPCDVYFINPVPIVEAIFPGTIQHGENCHPGLLGLLQRHIPVDLQIDLFTLYMDCNTFSLCNYFVGNRKFWAKYITFVNEFLTFVSHNSEDEEIVYRKSANYGPNKSLPYYTFAIERLFSVFLNLELRKKDGIRATHYPYTREALLTKTGLPEAIVDELIALSDIKQISISAGYRGMLKHWAFYRNRFCQQNPYIFLME
jgi:hypothetical protein